MSQQSKSTNHNQYQHLHYAAIILNPNRTSNKQNSEWLAESLSIQSASTVSSREVTVTIGNGETLQVLANRAEVGKLRIGKGNTKLSEWFRSERQRS